MSKYLNLDLLSFAFLIVFLLLHNQFLLFHSEQTHSWAEPYYNSSSPPMQQVIFPQVPENKQKQNGFVFLFCQHKHISFRFLALCLSLQHLDDNLLLLNQESAFDPER